MVRMAEPDHASDLLNPFQPTTYSSFSWKLNALDRKLKLKLGPKYQVFIKITPFNQLPIQEMEFFLENHPWPWKLNAVDKKLKLKLGQKYQVFIQIKRWKTPIEIEGIGRN